MEEKKIFVRCVIKDSNPYRIIKAIKPENEISFEELKERLGMQERELRNVLYHSLPSIIYEDDLVRLNENYDFVVVGGRGMAAFIDCICKKYNKRFQENIETDDILHSVHDW